MTDGISMLASQINTNSIQSPAYLVMDKSVLNFNYQPDSTGDVIYYFTNYGAEAQNNVSFKRLSKIL